jgi:hypothetical protein
VGIDPRPLSFHQVFPQKLQKTVVMRGVSKSCKRWRAQLSHRGLNVLRRTFDTKREAALAYIGALSLIDEEDAANVQTEYDKYESSDDDE